VCCVCRMDSEGNRREPTVNDVPEEFSRFPGWERTSSIGSQVRLVL